MSIQTLAIQLFDAETHSDKFLFAQYMIRLRVNRYCRIVQQVRGRRICRYARVDLHTVLARRFLPFLGFRIYFQLLHHRRLFFEPSEPKVYREYDTDRNADQESYSARQHGV